MKKGIYLCARSMRNDRPSIFFFYLSHHSAQRFRREKKKSSQMYGNSSPNNRGENANICLKSRRNKETIFMSKCNEQNLQQQQQKQNVPISMHRFFFHRRRATGFVPEHCAGGVKK